MRILFQAVLAGGMLASASIAATYYAAPGGDDDNSGSADAPFRTLARLTAAAGPGDLAIVRDGTYGPEGAVSAGDGIDAPQASPVVLSNSGTPQAWITITAEHKWGATLDCRMVCDAYIDLHDASYVTIQNFVITRGVKEGIHSNGAAHHITLRGNRIEFVANRLTSATFGLDGMYTAPACHDFTIDGNVFHDIGRVNSSQLDHGLYLRGYNHRVVNNVFYNIGRGWSIQLAGGLSSVLIANNTFAFPNETARGGQIILWDTQSNITIRNNIFYQPVNVAIARFNSAVTGCSIDHNLVFGVSRVVAESSGCNVDANQAGVDPMFVNAQAAPYDFHLTPRSPAIGFGAPVSNTADFDGAPRPSGAAPDAGAYAFVR